MQSSKTITNFVDDESIEDTTNEIDSDFDEDNNLVLDDEITGSSMFITENQKIQNELESLLYFIESKKITNIIDNINKWLVEYEIEYLLSMIDDESKNLISKYNLNSSVFNDQTCGIVIKLIKLVHDNKINDVYKLIGPMLNDQKRVDDSNIKTEIISLHQNIDTLSTQISELQSSDKTQLLTSEISKYIENINNRVIKYEKTIELAIINYDKLNSKMIEHEKLISNLISTINNQYVETMKNKYELSNNKTSLLGYEDNSSSCCCI